jgi:hypothetical protein
VGRELEAGNDVARGLGQPGREEPCVGADPVASSVQIAAEFGASLRPTIYRHLDDTR